MLNMCVIEMNLKLKKLKNTGDMTSVSSMLTTVQSCPAAEISPFFTRMQIKLIARD